MHTANPTAEPCRPFSLVVGGAVFHLFCKCHLAGEALELLYRRISVIVALAWLPLFVLVLSQFGLNSAAGVSFFKDVEVHARLLIALPVLLGAELVVHLRLGPVVNCFIDRHIILPEEQGKFEEAKKSATRLRNSGWIELALVLAVYTIGLLIWERRPVSPANWVSFGSRWDLTLAGFWYVFFSVPLFQFVLLRWYFRLFIWFRFLFQVSRMHLQLKPMHPDRSGGIGFLSKSAYAFGPILFAQGAVCAGLIGTRVLYGGEALLAFKQLFFGFLIFFLFTVLVPLTMFGPVMLEAKRKGLKDYGSLAHRYVEDFERKWIQNDSSSEEVLGTPDLQSLADLSNSYQIVLEMRLVPFKIKDVLRLSSSFAAPFLPLLLTVFSLEELISRIMKLLF